MDFICKDFNSALHSLSQVIGVSEDKIMSTLRYDWDKQYSIEHEIFLKSNASEESFSSDFGEYIFLNGFPGTILPEERPTIHWFHGARAIEPNSYLHEGILPLSEIYPRIRLMVDNIASRLNLTVKECKSDWQKHNKWLAELKLNDARRHGGPCAMLMYEAAATPEYFSNHSYIEEPEIISNYAYMMYDTDADLILAEFKRISSPIIVEFKEPDNAAELISLTDLITTNIQYLYFRMHNEEIGINGNICFSNSGQAVSANSIVKIYLIPK